MSSIASSGAFRDERRTLPQHQAALTLLQARVSVPNAPGTSWLDLACGRGQIIVALDINLSAQARALIAYTGYDIDEHFARETQKTAERLGFASLQTKVGDLSDFDRVLPVGTVFDFITLTNTVHEIAPASLASLLVNCMRRLASDGTLFIYDMERLKPPELGAVPWRREEIRRVVRRTLDALGAGAYHPEVCLWTHRSCDGWSVQLQRQHLGASVAEKAASATQAAEEEIVRVLREKLIGCRDALERLTKYGAETGEEQDEKELLLYEFWAVSRALGGGQ